jgi:hypothetical protein
MEGTALQDGEDHGPQRTMAFSVVEQVAWTNQDLPNQIHFRKICVAYQHLH